jgi:flagella basal body P-ring formation protein FlgA
MIRSVLRALACLIALTGAAAAQTAAPALRANVTVTAGIVRIGDLVENAGVVADIPIFRAPDLGTSGAVATERVVEAIRPHQLIDIDTRGLAEVVVTRASRAITAQEIAARVAQVLAGQYGLGEARNVSVTFDRAVRTLQVEPNATGELQPIALNYDARSGRFDASFDLPASMTLHRQPVRVTGIATETIEAVAVDRPVEHGEVLKASDLTILRRPKAEAGAMTDVAAVVGLAARRALRPGQPLYAADLMRPEIVQRNETVTILYEAPGLSLTLRGQAQDTGALGDSISVLNMQSKRVVQGVVSGPGRVTVSTATTHVAASATETETAAGLPPARPE